MVFFSLYLVILLFSLIPVAFYTLMERRVLGNFHIRYGPMQVGPLGLFQPFSDVIKLFSKSNFYLRFTSGFFWFLSPFLALFIYLILLVSYPLGGGEIFLDYMFLIFICFISFTVYFLLYGGYHSGSKYPLIGSYRSISQMISYEVILMFMFVGYFYLVGSWNLSYKMFEYDNMSLLFCMIFIFIWVLVMLAESNRLPYDFLEGESELVSGFNTEYWGGFFSFLFIFEYGMMLLFSIIGSYMLFSGLFSFFFFCFLVNFFLWIRATVPRFRYDQLMILAWKKLFFLVIILLFFFLMI